MHFLSSGAVGTAIAGLGFGFSLIVAIGAQNAFVLRQGLRREHVLVVVTVCAVSDVILIAAGTAGAGALLIGADRLLLVVRLVGGAYLGFFAARAVRRAARPVALNTDDDNTPARGAAFATALALTWLNPHVYLDTVVLLGSIAATHGSLRWVFACGAATASVVWFGALGYGARMLTPVFTRPAAWRVLDIAIAVIMVAVAMSLLLPVVADGDRSPAHHALSPTVALPGPVPHT